MTKLSANLKNYIISTFQEGELQTSNIYIKHLINYKQAEADLNTNTLSIIDVEEETELYHSKLSTLAALKKILFKYNY
jgi:GTP-sensing pleiotropic transcriptional regulator CodY